MKLTFLGTGAMVPTDKRNQISVLLNCKDEKILIDCGEGTQRQFRIGKINPTKITKILITHWHGDHVLGLPGLLQTLDKNQYNQVLEIYGPKNTKKYFKAMLKWFDWKLNIKVKIFEVAKKNVFKNPDLKIESIKLNHNTHCLGYSVIENDKRRIDMKYVKKFGLKNDPILKELQKGKNIKWKGKVINVAEATRVVKGKKVSFIMDTKFDKKIIGFVKDADLLVCESTLLHQLEAKANKYKHLTSEQAAQIAKKGKVKKLILTHFSQRYKDNKDLVNEARSIFKNSEGAEDFMIIEI